MLQIAFETTGKQGSLAILQGENTLWKRRLGVQRQTAAELAIELSAAMAWCEQRRHRIDWISVAVGPGSFTGLRIGITTAKTLGYALDLPIVAVGSLTAIAAVTPVTEGITTVLVGLNAFRSQVFATELSIEQLHSRELLAAANHHVELLQRSEWDRRVCRSVERDDQVFTGDRSIFADGPSDRLIAREEPDAVGVGRIAARLVAGERDHPHATIRPSVFTDPFALAARYLRQSAAEEKAASR
jgi:tRNA threonylcarbamoyl adenosine modification protein YeaZ